MSQKLKYALLGFLAAALGLWGLAVTIPNTFSGGEVVSAAKMNANFQALKDAVDTLEAKVAALESERDAQKTQTGMPRAVLSVYRDGTVLKSYNTTGGAITVTKTGTGQYTIQFSDETIDENDVVAVTPEMVGNRVCGAGYSASNLLVWCYDFNTGNFADSDFYLVLFND
jgi:hypothetical protein